MARITSLKDFQPLRLAVVRGTNVYLNGELVARMGIMANDPDAATTYAIARSWFRDRLEEAGCAIYDFSSDQN